MNCFAGSLVFLLPFLSSSQSNDLGEEKEEHTYVEHDYYTQVLTICTHIHTYIDTYIHTYIHIHIHRYIHTYIHIHIHRYIHTYTHTYIDTYIHTNPVSLGNYEQTYSFPAVIVGHVACVHISDTVPNCTLMWLKNPKAAEN